MRQLPGPKLIGTLSAGEPQADTVCAVRGSTLAEVLVKLLTMTTLPLGEVKTHLSELVAACMTTMSE